MTQGTSGTQNVLGAPRAWDDTVANAKAGPDLWTQFKSLFSTQTVSVGRLINAQEAFKEHFRAEIDRLAGTIPEETRQAFMDRAVEIMQSIIDDSLVQVHDEALQRGDGTVTERSLRTAIKSANGLAQKAFGDLEVLAMRARIEGTPQGDIRPQIFARPEGGFTVMREAPQIENLVLRGGGAKGIGYPPALVEMERVGLLSGLNHIIGTSAGALTAICLASGLDAQAFQVLSESMSMDDLKSKGEHFDVKYPNVAFGFGIHQAGVALETLDRQSAGSVRDYLEANWNSTAFQEKLAGLEPAQRERLEALRHQDFESDRTHQMITFGDLRLLHRLEPSVFKELTLTGWDTDKRDRGEDGTTYFSVDSHPDMPIAVAGRISMSMPVVFDSVKFDPGDGQGTRTWTDGGVGSNMPSEVVTGGLEGLALEEARARTMLMIFDMDGEGHTILHAPVSQRPQGASFIERLFGGNPELSVSQDRDRQKAYEGGPNTFVVFHGDLSSRDFTAGQDRIDHAKWQSTLKTLETIEQRMNQAYAVTVESVEQAVALLTDRERQAILDGGPPDPAAYPGGRDDPQYDIDKRMFDLVDNG